MCTCYRLCKATANCACCRSWDYLVGQLLLTTMYLLVDRTFCYVSTRRNTHTDIVSSACQLPVFGTSTAPVTSTSSSVQSEPPATKRKDPSPSKDATTKSKSYMPPAFTEKNLGDYINVATEDIRTRIPGSFPNLITIFRWNSKIRQIDNTCTEIESQFSSNAPYLC